MLLWNWWWGNIFLLHDMFQIHFIFAYHKTIFLSGFIRPFTKYKFSKVQKETWLDTLISTRNKLDSRPCHRLLWFTTCWNVELFHLFSQLPPFCLLIPRAIVLFLFSPENSGNRRQWSDSNYSLWRRNVQLTLPIWVRDFSSSVLFPSGINEL